jgi:hypothetical protein
MSCTVNSGRFVWINAVVETAGVAIERRHRRTAARSVTRTKPPALDPLHDSGESGLHRRGIGLVDLCEHVEQRRRECCELRLDLRPVAVRSIIAIRRSVG